MTNPDTQPEQVQGDDDLVAAARYRVILTDWSTSLSALKELIATHTRIPQKEIDTVLLERPAVIADAITRADADTLRDAFLSSGANVQVLARSVLGIEEALDEFLLASDAISVLLMDCSGFKIAERGDSSYWEVDKMLGLIAGVFAATKRVANHLGEEDFGTLFHAGDKASIHLSLVGERGLLVVQFDSRTTMRIVRLYATETAYKLARVL